NASTGRAGAGDAAVADGQPVQLHVEPGVDGEHARPVVAADGDQGGVRAVDDEVLADRQLAGGQGDGTPQATVEVHDVPRGGIQDGLAQRARPGVVEVGHGDRYPARLQRLTAGTKGGAARNTRTGRGGEAVAEHGTVSFG